MLANHEDHICRECKEKVPTFMKLLKHIPKNHREAQVEDIEVIGLDDGDIQEKNIKGK